jgi:hypothetical protein
MKEIQQQIHHLFERQTAPEVAQLSMMCLDFTTQ